MSVVNYGSYIAPSTESDRFLILSFGCQLCSYRVELIAHSAEPTPFVNGRFGSHILLLSNKSTASLLPQAIAKLKGDCPFVNIKILIVLRYLVFYVKYNNDSKHTSSLCTSYLTENDVFDDILEFEKTLTPEKCQNYINPLKKVIKIVIEKEAIKYFLQIYRNTTIRLGFAECSRRSFITLEAYGSLREHAMCKGVRPTIKSDISSDTVSFLQLSSDIDKYSFPISADAFGSAKLSSIKMFKYCIKNTFFGIFLLQSAPFSNNNLTTLISPAVTAKQRAGYGIEDNDGSAPLLNNKSIIFPSSLRLIRFGIFDIFIIQFNFVIFTHYISILFNQILIQMNLVSNYTCVRSKLGRLGTFTDYRAKIIHSTHMTNIFFFRLIYLCFKARDDTPENPLKFYSRINNRTYQLNFLNLLTLIIKSNIDQILAILQL
ncbi:hypothetical protein BpHYR1_000235 [Brachionus plicatilis]|uniref:Uncharacterized protein n=1 Tax=Brachionus plicatilis TaxID=10195 RepID=A0A3M7PFI1_BRAPC|nr:hypothetical protein BpHYR1_000235 [Brachionus plicatilis]